MMLCKHIKPEFEHLLRQCHYFYLLDGCSAGGPLHNLLDDDNFDDSSILFCMCACLDAVEKDEVSESIANVGLDICNKYAKLSMLERAAFDSLWNCEKLNCTKPDGCEKCRIMSLLD